MASSPFAHDAVQEAAGSVLDGAEHVLFAAGGVHEQPQRDGQRHFFREEGDLLILAIFGDFEVILFEVGDDALVLVAHGDEEIDQVHVGFDDRPLSLRLLRQRRHGDGGGKQGRHTQRCEFLERRHVYFP